MNRQFFEIQMHRITSTFGEKAYSSDRVEIIWSKFSIVSNEAFSQAVDNLIGNSRYAPLLHDFDAELAGQMVDAKQNRIEKISQGKHCHGCNNTGRVSIEIDPKYANYSFRCHCVIGRTLYPNFPVYNSKKFDTVKK